ncbi:MAG TPA: thiol reductant ABC exporter subunit CydD [Solirubrobacteraceae bacterium]|nr:thiol reductant ABC exporter subunit CydD [Solirubrobacteraceae bacterium]
MSARTYDPRLLRHAPATRTLLAVTVALGTLAAVALVAQAWLLADVIGSAVDGHSGVAQLRGPLAALLGVVVARAAIAWLSQVAASRTGARAKSQLRAGLLRGAALTGPDGLVRERSGELAMLATRGIDALDAYYTLYLPQLCLVAIVPLVVVAAIAAADWISAAIIAATLPQIPLFMALVGASTQERMDEQFRLLQRLGGHFLDVVTGLGTLKVFGRAKAQIATIATVTERYRRVAIATLRISFLSSLVLELVSTVSVAIVAVAVGLRLLGGDLDLRTALFVLVLAPEAYLPLRQLGANYHASVEGMSAAQQAFDALERPLPTGGPRTDVPDPSVTGLSVRELTVLRAGSPRPVLEGLSLTIEPGQVVAVTGPSGCGKSTLLGVLLGLVAQQAGSVYVGEVELGELDLAAWRARLAWVPQRPHMFAASIADNVRLGRPDASARQLSMAIAAAGLDDVVERLPDGLQTPLGSAGAVLSAGESQRVALARAFLRDTPLLLLDEPTAALDGATEEQVLKAVRSIAHDRTTVIAAHRPALIALADSVVALDRTMVVA